MSQRYGKEYAAYLSRALAELGNISVGHYAKFQGQLVKKLSYQEFEERWERFTEARKAYDEILQQGDTVNDAIVHLINEYAAELLLKV
jgi:hypothetical protein